MGRGRIITIAGAFSLALAVGIHAPANAEMRTSRFLALYDSSDLKSKAELESSIELVEAGLAWASLYSEKQGGVSLYCTPKKVALTGSQLISILRKGKEDRSGTDVPFGLELLLALKAVFPCPKK